MTGVGGFSAPIASLSLHPSWREAGWNWVAGELFYIFVNRVSESSRKARSSSARKEFNLAFMAVVIGRILWRSFYSFY